MASSSVATMPRIDHDQSHDPWSDLRPIRPHLINTSTPNSPPTQQSESSPKSRSLETEVSGTSSGGSGKVGDLIQMWRVMEAEAISPTNKGNQQHLVFEERNGSWEACDDVTGWESDLTVESDREQGSLKKREKERAFGGAGILDGNHLLKVRGRHITQKLFEKLECERKNEIDCMKQKHAVSGFAHRKKLNSFLKYKSMQNQKADQNLRPQSTRQELDQLNCRIPILLLRQQFSPRPMHTQSCHIPFKQKICLDSKCSETRQKHQQQLETCKSAPVYKKKDNILLPADNPISIDSETCESRSSAIEDENENQNQRAEVLNHQAEEDYPASESEQEGNRHLDLSWEEGSPRMGRVDWEKPNGQEEPPYTDLNHPIEEADHDDMWLTTDDHVYSSHIILQDDEYREAMYSDLLETFSDNSELRQLLERRTVTTSLSSDFSMKLNKLMLSCIQNQRMAESEAEENDIIEEYIEEEEEPIQTHDPGLVDDGQPVHPQDSGSVDNEIPQPLIGMDVLHIALGLRTEIADVRNEMKQLRKLVACCMQKNTLHSPIEDNTVLRRSASSGNVLSSQWEPVQKGNCYICYGKQVDSLIYRCGHMCTCFECGTKLQWSSGRCPVCRIPIIDVVRAYVPS